MTTNHKTKWRESLMKAVICEKCDYGYIIRGECTNPICPSQNFCHWSQTDTQDFFGIPVRVYETTCRRQYSDLVNFRLFTYCPFCGKQIEVKDG